MRQYNFQLIGFGPIVVDVKNLVIAGWTGRDMAMVEHHIAELEALGVARPQHIPSFYNVAASLLSTSDTIQVSGRESSGEAEFVMLSTAHGLLVGIGSDHTDRKAETIDVTMSKQLCEKPIGPNLWRFAELEDHWDDLIMLTWREINGQRSLYQEGPVSRMLGPRDLIHRCFDSEDIPPGTAMFCGTHPVIGELGFGEAFEIELYDPRLERSLKHRYLVQALPVPSVS